jgi:PAS domain S-box-containing protein
MKEELSIDEAARRIAELEDRLEEAESLIDAIKAGEVDAFALNRDNKPEIFTLQSGDYGYRMLIENFNEGAVTLSDDSLIVYSNKYFHELLGCSYAEVIGKPVFNFIHPDSKLVFNDLFKKGLAGQSRGELQLVSGDKAIPVYVSLTSLYPAIQTVGMIVTDLTEKKKQDRIIERHKELEIEKRLLEESGKTIRRIMEFDEAVMTNMGEGLYTVDNMGIVTTMNPAAEKLFGWKKEELVGKKMHDATHYKHRDGSTFPATDCAGLGVLTTGVVLQNYEDTFIRKNGTFFDVMYSASPLIRGGEQEGLIVVFRDITAEKEAERKLAESQEQLRQFTVSLEEKVMRRTAEIKRNNEALEKMNKELESFAYISSHDLQEPLRKIQTFVTRIIEKEIHNLSPQGQDMFNRMQLSAKRMQTLIGDLLAYSRTGNLEPDFQRTDLNRVLAQIKEDLKEEIEEKGATIQTTSLVFANIIPFQFRQMLHNIISNSLKFSKPGNPIQIKVTSERVESYEPLGGIPVCHISIEDNGIGFDEQYSDRIFEVFQRLHARSDYEGTGIGLSIVKRIVENHKGHITAWGETGKGARFDIYIPDWSPENPV